MHNISIQPEFIFYMGKFAITNSFFTAVIVTYILVILTIIYEYSSGIKNNFAQGISIAFALLLRFIDQVTNDRKVSKQLFPLIATFFIFILTANLLGLLPGFLGAFYVNTNGKHIPFLRTPNSDLTITMALALISVFSIQYYSWKELGAGKYIKRFIDFSNPLTLILGFFELLSESVKVLSFSFRLFGNIFAGEVLLLVFAFLMPYIIPLPFMILEIFIGVIQAFIFTLLTLTFIRAASLENNDVILSGNEKEV